MHLIQKLGLIVVGVVVTVVGFMGVNAAFAQTGDGATLLPELSGEPVELVEEMEDWRGDFEAALAEALGISIEELRAAQDEAHQSLLDQAVAEGRLTEEQASLIEARHALRGYLDRGEILEDATGISREERQEALQSTMEAALQQAVADGVITQEQADQLQEAPRGWGGRFHRHIHRHDAFGSPGG